jgi:drug/metabolite transporter (DMT)-like permease
VLPADVIVVLLGCLGGALVGAINVTARIGMRRFADAEAGGLIVALISLVGIAAIAAASGARPADVDLDELWPFLVAGTVVPGMSQILWIRSVRDVGPSRSAIVMGISPLVSAAIAVVALGEPFRPPLLAGTLLIVAGAVALAWERTRPVDFRRVGIVLALVAAVLQAGRDNAVRSVSEDSAARPLVAATAMIAGACALLLVYVVWIRRGGLPLREARAAIVPFLPSGLIMAGIYTCFLEALERGRVTVVAPLVGTYGLWTVAFAALFLGRSEAIGRRLVLSAALIVVGGALIGAFR